jgi:hypothetical protein
VIESINTDRVRDSLHQKKKDEFLEKGEWFFLTKNTCLNGELAFPFSALDRKEQCAVVAVRF